MNHTIPQIAELRRIVERSEQKYGKSPPISKCLIQPHVSVRCTRLLLLAGLSGLQVTMLMSLTAILGAALFFLGAGSAYILGSLLMLTSWLLDHCDGEVCRYRGESTIVGIYLDRFTHRVSYPLLHLGMGVSLFQRAGDLGYLLLGAVVAYFYQLSVSHALDKLLMSKELRGLECHPLKALREAIVRRVPALERPAWLVIGLYAQLRQNYAFLVLLIVATVLDALELYYVIYGSFIIADWVLTAIVDFGFVFKARQEPAGATTTKAR